MTLLSLPIIGHTADGRPIRRIRNSADMLALDPKRYKLDRHTPATGTRDKGGPRHSVMRRASAIVLQRRRAVPLTDIAADLRCSRDDVYRAAEQLAGEYGCRLFTIMAPSRTGQRRACAHLEPLCSA